MTLTSAPAISDAYGSLKGEVYLTLLELNHANWAEPYRFINDLSDTVSNSKTFQSFGFAVDLPAETDDEPEARLQVANVSRTLNEIVTGLTSRPTAKMQIVLASSPDTVEAEWDGFELHSISGNALTIEGVLTQREYTSEIAGPRMTASGFAFLRH